MQLELQLRSHFLWISSHFQPWWRYIWWVTCAQIDWRYLNFCGSPSLIIPDRAVALLQKIATSYRLHERIGVSHPEFNNIHANTSNMLLAQHNLHYSKPRGQ